MKIRNGFVSNSSSGSFIFPKKYSEDEIEQKLNLIVEFANKFENTDKYTFDSFFGCLYTLDDRDIEREIEKFDECREIGTRGLKEKYSGSCKVTTACENSVPFWMYNFLCNKMGATYIHNG